MRSVLKALGDLPDFRPAEPGEFTFRSFEHGRMDLTQVEGLRDLVNAETEMQRRLALRQADGQVARIYERLRAEVKSAMALMEALLDFGEDQNVEEGVYFEGARRELLCTEKLRVKSVEASHSPSKDRGSSCRPPEAFGIECSG